MRRLVPRPVLAGLLIAAIGAAAWAQEAILDLQPPPAGDFWRPADPIVIRIAPGVSDERLRRLALELDAFEVTRLLRREGDLAILELPSALETGEHRLRAVEYRADGSIVELAVWTVTVRNAAGLAKLEADVGLAGNAAYRAFGDNTQGAARWSGQSAGQGTALVGDDGWEAEAFANYLFDSQGRETAGGRDLDLGEYLLASRVEADTLRSELRLGHHDIGAQNLIVNALDRRGLSFNLGSTDGRAALTGFAFRPESVVGVRHFTGITSSENRLWGVHGTVRPIEALEDNLEVTATYYRGEGELVGDAEGGIEEVVAGDGWSVAADGLWFGQRLRSRGEFAMTRFDPDGSDGVLGTERDHAYVLFGNYALVRDTENAGDLPNLFLGAQYERIGTFFESLGNPSIAPDRKTTTLFSTMDWGEVSGQAQVSHQTTNVRGFDQIPRDRIYNVVLNGTYVPEADPDDDAGWLGQPLVSLSYNMVDIRQVDQPAGFPGIDTDNTTHTTTLSWTSSYTAWDWTASETVSVFSDRSGQFRDITSYVTEANANIRLGARLSVSPFVQWNRVVDRDFDDVGDDVLTGVDLTVAWIPRELDSIFSYSLNRAGGLDDKTWTHNASGELVWTVFEPKRHRPGVSLSLSGSYANGPLIETLAPSASSGTGEVYQVFLGVKVQLSTGY